MAPATNSRSCSRSCGEALNPFHRAGRNRPALEKCKQWPPPNFRVTGTPVTAGVPDNGSTAMLLGLGVVAIAFVSSKKGYGLGLYARTAPPCARNGPGITKPPMTKFCSRLVRCLIHQVALNAHALGDLECRDDTPLDLLVGLSGSFARSPIRPAGLIEVRNKSVALDGCRLKQGQ
jgi:hypothetical protein